MLDLVCLVFRLMTNFKKVVFILGLIFVAAAIFLLIFLSSIPPGKPAFSGSNNSGVTYKETLVRELVARPESYLNQNVQLRGKLISEGNQTSAKFYLVDGQNRIMVGSWLPLEVNLPPGNGSVERPKMMLNFVGQFLTLKGQIKSGSKGWYFIVQSAEVFRMPPD